MTEEEFIKRLKEERYYDDDSIKDILRMFDEAAKEGIILSYEFYLEPLCVEDLLTND